MFSARRRIGFGSLVVAVGVSGFGVQAITAPVTAAPPVKAEPDAGQSGPLTRPDSISAMVTAQASGERVEDLSQGDEATRVFANPDGSWTSDTTPGPQRVRDEEGEWVGVDTTLVKVGGRLVPTASAVEMSLSAGGDKVFADAIPDGGVAKDELAWRWSRDLPEPVVDGSTATYVDAVEGGGDLVVTATPTGFTHNIVLHEVPAGLANEGDTPVDGPVFEVPVVTPGAKLEAAVDGSLEVVDTKGAGTGDQVAAAPTPLMWDSSEDPDSGDPVVETVDVSVANSTASNGTPIGTIALAPSVEFLTDPATVYPVTIDPTFTLLAQVDTWVSTAYPSSQSGSDELRAGTSDGGTNKARSYLKFPGDSTWDGTQILSAKLTLRNWSSSSCSGAAVRAQRLLEPFNSTTISWSSQPEASNFYSADYVPGHGGANCSADDATWNIKDMVQAWADNALDNNGLRLRAVDETNSATYRKYRSLEYGNVRPKIVVTYNRAPGVPTAVTATPLTTYAAPGQTAAATYTSDATPKVSAKVADPDGSKVQITIRAHASDALSSTVLGSCSTASIAQNTTGSCTLSALADNSTVYLRAKAKDEHGNYPGGSLAASAGWSAAQELRVAETVPDEPVISCPTPYSDGSWHETAPASAVECTIAAVGSGQSAPGYINWSLNGAPERRDKITPSSDTGVAKVTVTVPKELGAYELTAKAESAAGVLSPTKTYGFGYGPFTMSSPLARIDDGVSVTTTDRVTLVAEGPTNTETDPEPVIKWRVAGSGEDEATGWTDAGVTDYDVTTPTNGTSSVTAVVDTRSFDDGNGGPSLTRPVVLELQICLPYPSTTACTWSSEPVRVLRVPNAFGGNYPADVAGPGEVALWTGEFGLAETDATEPGYATELGVSRSHGSFGGPAEDLDGGPSSVFGPGWTASLDGPGIGVTDAILLDNSAYDGTLALVDPAGDALVWSKDTPATWRTDATLPTGVWSPVDEVTQLSEVKLAVTGTGAGTKVEITDVDGTVTTFKVIEAITGDADYEFTPDSVQDPMVTGAAGKTTFAHDNQGRVTRILSPIPQGVASCPTTGTLPDGCHALTLSYGTSGNSNDRLTQIHVVHGATSTLVTSYDYDTQGRLVEVTDERTALATTYAWAGTEGAASRRIATITPPGLKPLNFDYDSDGKLVEITRENPTGSGSTTISQLRYDIPTKGEDATSADLPVLDAPGVAVWNQAETPAYGAAAFPQGSPTVSTDSGEITAGQWKHASLSYTDLDGRTVNTADYGADRWQLTAADYDEHDNIIRSLGAGDIAAIVDQEIAPSDAGSINVYGPVKNSLDEVTIPAGTVLTETYGPARLAVISDTGGLAGETKWVRPHTVTSYDQDAPNNGINPATGAAYGLETKSITRPWDPATGADITGAGTILAESRSGYAALESGDKSGWELGAPTTDTTVMPSGQADIVTRTRYDDDGRVIETRQPSSNGTDAGTRQTIYYTAGTNSADAACGNQAAWAALVCVTKHAAGGLPVERVTSYNANLQPLELTQTVSGTLRRTITNTYDSAGRSSKSWTKNHSMGGSTATTGTLIEYDPATGFETTAKAIDNTGAVISGKSTVASHDSWGRQTSYTVNTGTAAETTTTTYNTAGDVDQVTDPRGTTTYTYDGTDADGKTEHRGLITKIATSRPGTSAVEFTGAYNADETLITHKIPGGLTQRTKLNTAGEPTDMVYTGRVNLPDLNDPGGALVATDDVAWVGWSQTSDIFGRTRAEWTPEGAAFTGGLDEDAATGYARGYTYDRAGRLTEVVDHTAPNGAGTTTVEDGITTTPGGTTCETRTYGFDINGNRTSLNRKGHNTDGTCATSGGTTRNWAYDGADRPDTGAGYALDDLGRITTLPSADTPVGGSPVSLAYYDSDAIRSITQGSLTSTYVLDPIGRRQTETTVNGGTTTAVDMHYVADGDNPGWSQATTTTSGGTEVLTTRYLDNIAGDLSATLASTGTSTTASADLELALANPHGDIVTTVTIPTSGPATGIDAWATYDEYGNPGTGETVGASPTSDSGIGYGWVGAKQRATEAHGLILMGARPYNPVTGQFTSMDPVYGGNSTTYAYPQDPINGYDLDGRCWLCDRAKSAVKKVAKTVKKAAKATYNYVRRNPLDAVMTVAMFVPGLNAAAAVYRGYRAVKAVNSLRKVAKVARKVRKTAAKECSFAGDTLVLMGDGSKKRIDEVAVGDEVLASDPESGESLARKVEHVFVHVDLVVDMVVDGERLRTTVDHPFWSVTDQAFERADQLVVGEILQGAQGERLYVDGFDEHSLLFASAYNLAVAEIHTYHVGDSGALVHNQCGPRPKGHTAAGKRGAKNSGKQYDSEAAARNAAIKYAGKHKSCTFRGPCSKGDHVHVDKVINNRKVHTRHYYW